MDPYFEFFLENFGPTIDRRDVPPDALAHFKGRLPDQWLAYWEAQGWCGYADGLFWTVDPREYEPVLQAWLGGMPIMAREALHIVARTAMGHLLIWGEQSGFVLQLFAPGSYVMRQSTTHQKDDLAFAARMFFSVQGRDVFEFDGRFTLARQRLGELSRDEMYGFVPALALGGSSDAGQIEKVQAIEHLVFLAQLGPLEVLG